MARNIGMPKTATLEERLLIEKTKTVVFLEVISS
jgi:hypothetical protein